ncbi:copper amine oxidase N-terminal domain-containing protein [Aminipila terrae]|uniref:Copper amine oxidase-like N-terminal domain-containing protein n=1 Tax=Aminipila terrae TaxID=2697030 RepID=A0A6P1MHP3_9FIRM|nr:copper amine oxidase N-terminal domain-containing protein [Aminipila terrae]QHI72703.1 hypothetical protein Ami3637_10105 [Aminipila terrae]
MKKIMSIITIVLLILSLTLSNVFADQKTAAKAIEFSNIDYTKSNYVRVILNNEQVKFDVNPVVKDGRTLVPVRKIFEAMGMEVKWDEATKEISAEGEGATIKMKLDSCEAAVNNKEVTLDVPAQSINNRTLVPIRFISESLGYHVVWIEKSNLILMSKDDIWEWRTTGYESRPPYMECEYKFINGVQQLTEFRYTGKVKQDASVKVSNSNLKPDKIYLSLPDLPKTISSYYTYTGDLISECLISQIRCESKYYDSLNSSTTKVYIAGTKIGGGSEPCVIGWKVYEEGIVVDSGDFYFSGVANGESFKDQVVYIEDLKPGVQYRMEIFGER